MGLLPEDIRQRSGFMCGGGPAGSEETRGASAIVGG